MILVTGSSGFIGRNLIKSLLSDGNKVIGIDIEDCPDYLLVPTKTSNLTDENFTFIKGDLRDSDVLRALFERPIEYIVHLAAFTRVVESVNKPSEYFENNVVVTQRLSEEAIKHGVKKFLFASTNAVAGDVGYSVINENNALFPQSPYGANKAASEMMLNAYKSSYGLGAVRLRFTNIYGKDMATKDSFIARMCKAALGDKKIAIYGDGTQVRDYVYLDDVIGVIKRVLSLGSPDILVVGSGSSVSVNELVKLVEETIGLKFSVEYQDAKKGEMKAVIVDNSSLKSIGIDKTSDLSEGLRFTWEWFKHSSHV